MRSALADRHPPASPRQAGWEEAPVRHETARVHRVARGSNGFMAVRCTRAAVDDAGDRLAWECVTNSLRTNDGCLRPGTAPSSAKYRSGAIAWGVPRSARCLLLSYTLHRASPESLPRVAWPPPPSASWLLGRPDRSSKGTASFSFLNAPSAGFFFFLTNPREREARREGGQRPDGQFYTDRWLN